METEYGNLDEWEWKRINKSYFYNLDVVLAGSTQTVNLNLGRKPLLINRISMYFSSVNPRTFYTRIYARSTPTYYETIDMQVGHIGDSRIRQIEHKYTPHKIAWIFSDYTADDIVSLEVQADAL